MLRAWLCAFLLSIGFVPADALAQRDAMAGIGDVALGELPAEARETIALIHHGGPFPYAKDGIVFGNRERILPPATRGYYREYTVKTPGVRTRGARRIIAGRGGELFYSDDHYNHFRRIRE